MSNYYAFYNYLYYTNQCFFTIHTIDLVAIVELNQIPAEVNYNTCGACGESEFHP